MGKHDASLGEGANGIELQPDCLNLFITCCRQAVERRALAGGTKVLLYLLDPLKG